MPWLDHTARCYLWKRGPVAAPYFLLSLLSRNLPWARPNWVRKHYAVREDVTAVAGKCHQQAFLGHLTALPNFRLGVILRTTGKLPLWREEPNGSRPSPHCMEDVERNGDGPLLTQASFQRRTRPVTLPASRQ